MVDPLDIGGFGYVAKNATATFDGTLALVNAGAATTVTVTVTALTGSPTAPSSGALVFAPAPTITDSTGDPAIGTFTTAPAFGLF